MKKIICTLLLTGIVLCMAGCGANDSSTNDAAQEQTDTSVSTVDEASENSDSGKETNSEAPLCVWSKYGGCNEAGTKSLYNYGGEDVLYCEKHFSKMKDVLYSAAQDAVTEYLKNPGTAEWPDIEEISISQDGYTYKISGYVDAENGFGALGRVEYDIELEDTSKDDVISSTSAVTLDVVSCDIDTD